jgi:arylsulfatase A-like enzyme
MTRHWLICLVALGLSGALGQAAAKRPNVLFIAIDDLNDWVGCLGGHPQVRTPNIDRLASRGVLFSNAHCQAPICNPSRVSLLTGVLPSTSGVYELNQPHHLSPVLKDAVTLPAHFKSSGYHVLGRGKIYHGRYEYPADWHDFKTTGDARNQQWRTKPVSSVPGIRVRDFGPIDLPEEQFGDLINARWAAGQLQRDFGRPFFMAVGIRLPHVPLYAPRRFFERHPEKQVKLPVIREDDLADLPPAGLQITRYMHNTPLNHNSVLASGNWRNAVAAYLACTEFVDHCVGVMLDALDASDHAKDTLVVLWSDHGWHLGEKRHWAKRSLWGESTRVPLIVAGPGLAKDNCLRSVGLIDLYPTLTELCGLAKPPQTLEGHSLVPLLQKPDAAWSHPAITTFHQNDHTVRTGRWRYIRYANGDEELYDCSADPHEWINLAAKPEHRGTLAQLRLHLPKVNVVDAPVRASGR